MTAIVRAVQLGDSLFPVGAFAFSNGLESAVEHGVVHDAESLERFVRAVTREAAGCDGVALLAAHRAACAEDQDAVRAADRALHARKTNEELRRQCVRMGRKLAAAGTVLTGAPMAHDWRADVDAGRTPGTYAAGLGLLSACLGMGEEGAFAVHQYGVAAMMTGAALRLMRLDHLEAQHMLYRTNESVAEDHRRVAGLCLADMASFTPQLDVLSAAHTRAHVRLFMS